MKIIWIGIAGSLGAIARYGLGGWVARARPDAFPWSTFVINVVGSFVLGLVFVLTAERFAVDPRVRTALTIGFLGAFTTFSTFSFETMRLLEDGATGLAVLNIAASVGAGLAAVFAGTWIGRAL